MKEPEREKERERDIHLYQPVHSSNAGNCQNLTRPKPEVQNSILLSGAQLLMSTFSASLDALAKARFKVE